MDVVVGGRRLAVECKRLETGEYGDRERAQIRELWGPVSNYLAHIERSTFVDVTFDVPVEDVDSDYLANKVREWLRREQPSYEWNDLVSKGLVRDLDLKPLQDVLCTDEVLCTGTRIQELLSGSYLRLDTCTLFVLNKERRRVT